MEFEMKGNEDRQDMSIYDTAHENKHISQSLSVKTMKDNDFSIPCKICFIFILIMLLLSSMIAIGVTAFTLIHLKSQLISSELNINVLLNRTLITAHRVDELYEFINLQSISTENNTRNIRSILKTTAQEQVNMLNALSNIEATGSSTSGIIKDILITVNRLLEQQNGLVLSNSIQPISCQDILDVHPGSPSGYYHVNSRNIYCNMGELCGSGGGWTRLAYLDMTDATQSCPRGFHLYQREGVRACGRLEGGPSTVSVKYPSYGISYSQVCGRVVGYQYGTPDAVGSDSHHNDLNSYYVDGISITRGSPRQHVWTLMAGVKESHPDVNNCPCSPSSTQEIQPFIGSHYFCESGSPENIINSIYLYTSDPLWDGQGCGTQETACCSAPGLPWFYRDYGNTTTTDFLELRVCSDQQTGNEDIPVNKIEIFVK